MLMRAAFWIVLAVGFCIGLSMTGCAELPKELAATEPSLEGRWQVMALQSRHDCPELGSVAPVDPGGLTLSRQADGWLVQPRSGDGVLWQEQSPGIWTRTVSTQWEGCLTQASATWRFDGVGATQFSARFDARLAVSGADCQAPVDTCTASYTVSGARLPEAP